MKPAASTDTLRCNGCGRFPGERDDLVVNDGVCDACGEKEMNSEEEAREAFVAWYGPGDPGGGRQAMLNSWLASWAASRKRILDKVLELVGDHHDTVDNSDGVGGFPNLAMTITQDIEEHFSLGSEPGEKMEKKNG